MTDSSVHRIAMDSATTKEVKAALEKGLASSKLQATIKEITLQLEEKSVPTAQSAVESKLSVVSSVKNNH